MSQVSNDSSQMVFHDQQSGGESPQSVATSMGSGETEVLSLSGRSWSYGENASLARVSRGTSAYPASWNEETQRDCSLGSSEGFTTPMSAVLHEGGNAPQKPVVVRRDVMDRLYRMCAALIKLTNDDAIATELLEQYINELEAIHDSRDFIKSRLCFD